MLNTNLTINSYIRAHFTSNITIATTGEYIKMPFTETALQYGNNLKLDNGDVVIGNDIDIIYVNASLYCIPTAQIANRHICIFQNNLGFFTVFNRVEANDHHVFTCPGGILSVKPGDRISLRYRSPYKDTILHSTITSYINITALSPTRK